MTGIDIREMTAGDLEFCLEMFRITGWGNTADDVLRMISYEPGGCFVASMDGEDREGDEKHDLLSQPVGYDAPEGVGDHPRDVE